MSNGNSQQREATEDLDEEGLRKNGYDAILCGTGLTQSILAAALARAGKSILHCDGNDFYGDVDAVLSLGALIEWASEISAEHVTEDEVKEDGKTPLYASESSSVRIDSLFDPESDEAQELEEGMAVMTPYGKGTILSDCIEKNPSSVAIEFDGWKMADGRSPRAYFGKGKEEIVPLGVFQYKEFIESRQRSFALDLSPVLLHANGDAVDGMINSGVSDYCEFKSVIGLHLFMKHVQKKAGAKSNKEESMASLSRVPCSKRDVFQTKLLSPMDKRRLMKFLQIASDYAVAMSSPAVPSSTCEEDENQENSKGGNDVEEEVVTSLNERQLQQGRSLYRPQNKTVATSDLEVLEKCIQEGMDFDTYLSKHHKLSDHMKKIVIHAMSMGSHSTDYSTKAGMNDLTRHLQSLGKYGGTAFLATIYGSGELSQAFCRSAAVHGGTYLLRRRPKSISIDESGKACGVVVNGFSFDDSEEEKPTFIAAPNIIVPKRMLKKELNLDELASSTGMRVYRRISILRGKLVTNEEGNADVGNDQRHIIVIPPGDVHIGNQRVINGITLDESVNIAPRDFKDDFDLTILYLSTISRDMDGGEKLLQKAAKSLCQNNSNLELFHLGFSFDYDDSIHSNYDDYTQDGIYVCQSRGISLTAEAAFVEAKSIFDKICPNDNFLKLSKVMDDLVKECRNGLHEDEDDEVKMLESAMNMIDAS